MCRRQKWHFLLTWRKLCYEDKQDKQVELVKWKTICVSLKSCINMEISEIWCHNHSFPVFYLLWKRIVLSIFCPLLVQHCLHMIWSCLIAGHCQPPSAHWIEAKQNISTAQNLNHPCVPDVIDGSHFLISTYIHAWNFMVQNFWICWVSGGHLDHKKINAKLWWKSVDQNMTVSIPLPAVCLAYENWCFLCYKGGNPLSWLAIYLPNRISFVQSWCQVSLPAQR